jgi:hypothetical protein
MAAMTDYLENKLIDFMFRGQAFTPPATWYVALFTAAPSDAGGGTEVSGTGYARVGIASSTANFAATNAAGSTANPSTGTSGTTSNNVAINFPTPGGSWGTITHCALFDASSGGNMMGQGALATARTVTDAGTPVSFAAGTLTFQIDN